MQRNRQSIIIILLAVVLGLILPFLVQHGMFMDGTQYAVVSRNLAEGIGTFWFPHLSPTWYRAGESSFLEQPPLFYYLESQVFRLFGDSMYSERVFCLLCLIVTALLIHDCWRTIIQPEEKHRAWGPIAVFLFLVTPVVFWTYRNNMIEMLLTVMVLASTSLIARAVIFGKPWAFIPAGVFVFLGILTKGLPALFPLAFPFCWYMFNQKKYSFLQMSCVTISTAAICTGLLATILFTNNQAFKSLSFYFFNRVLARLSDEPVVSNQFSSLIWLLLELLVMGSLVAIARFSLRSKDSSPFPQKKFWLLVTYGLCGVLPLLLTPVQRSFYLVPALPFFAVAATSVIAPSLSALFTDTKKHVDKTLRVIAFMSVLSLIVYTALKTGDTSRDNDVLQDVHSIASSVGHQTNIPAREDVYSRWDLQFYLLRYHQIPIGGTFDDKSLFYLTIKAGPCPKGYDSSTDLKTVRICYKTGKPD